MAKKKSMKSKSPTQLPLEDAMDELQGIVGDLEAGQEPLNDSLVKFERGMELLRLCHQQLEQATQRIEVVTRIDSSGDFETVDFDGAATLGRNTGDGSSAEEEKPKLF